MAAIRVLLLEDDPADARLVGHMLRRVKGGGFEVAVVGRLAQAVERLAGADPADVVLADLTVPDSTGLDTLRALAAAAPRLPVVALTGNDDEDLALEALKNGAQDYVVKGSGDGSVLARVLRYAIERKAGELALKEARDRAEAAARAKSVFLAMVGHEIRTPLNGILGMTRLLLETGLDPRQHAFAETVASSGELLLGLVNDILDFARLDAEGLTLERVPFDVTDTVEEVRRLLSPRADEKGLTLTWKATGEMERTVAGDPLRLRQVLLNLVGNAIKFTDHGGVLIHVERAQGQGAEQRLRFTVADSGIGIPEEARANLFTEFWQGEGSIGRRHGGAGLGLAICRRLIRLMGGQIAYDSEPGLGSTFRVELPLPASAGAQPVRPTSKPGAPPPRRVLLVDDNAVNLAVAEGLLERRGHSVVAVEDGAGAVEAARAGGFDMVLLDMVMPGMDGIDTARAIRALPGEAGRVPIALVTANAPAADERRWREAGILACLGKPFRAEEVDRLLAGLGQSDGGPRSAAGAPPLLAPADLAADLDDLGLERMRGLADLFRRSSAADLDAALGHARSGRLAELAPLVHRMAGAAASLHLARLAQCCRAAETAARAGDSAAVAVLAAGLADLWQASLAELDAALG